MTTVAVVFAIALFVLVLLYRARMRRAKRYTADIPGEHCNSLDYPTILRRSGGDK